MGKYSIRGSADFDAHIDTDMQRIAECVSHSPYAKDFKAIILIGGYARGEGTPCIREGKQMSFNDYDLVVVSSNMPRSRQTVVQEHLRTLEKQLTNDIGLPTDLYLYTENKMRTAEFSLLNYEMKFGHMVIWGDQNIADIMPNYVGAALPISEGTRLLLNRGKLLIDIQQRLATQEPLTPEERETFIKFLFKSGLAFGDCTLLINGKYDISYTEKKVRIEDMRGSDVPDSNYMIAAFRKAIGFKEWGDFEALQDLDIEKEFHKTRAYFIDFFLWYEGRRLKTDTQTTAAYARALHRNGREVGRVKSAIHNLLTFRQSALSNKLLSICDHPRLRLYLALPLLLQDDPDTALLSTILKCEPQQILERFYALQRRFS